MKISRNRWMVAGLIAVGLAVTGCSVGSASADEEAQKVPPARVETIPGKNVKKVTLTEQASRRVGIQTAVIGAETSPVPYSAVLYDPNGEMWVYAVTEPLTYVREKVVVASVNGTDAVLSEGPPAGTMIVSVGVIELYGAELGVGK